MSDEQMLSFNQNFRLGLLFRASGMFKGLDGFKIKRLAAFGQDQAILGHLKNF